MDIIEFSKKINYPDFKHDIIEYFSENAALYQIISKTSDISIDATVEENGSISYILSLEDNDIINLLENLLNDPITMFGTTHKPYTKRIDKGLIVYFRTTA